MKKSLVIATCFSLVLILSLSIVSAGWFGDLWDRGSGNDIQFSPAQKKAINYNEKCFNDCMEKNCQDSKFIGFCKAMHRGRCIRLCSDISTNVPEDESEISSDEGGLILGECVLGERKCWGSCGCVSGEGCVKECVLAANGRLVWGYSCCQLGCEENDAGAWCKEDPELCLNEPPCEQEGEIVCGAANESGLEYYQICRESSENTCLIKSSEVTFCGVDEVCTFEGCQVEGECVDECSREGQRRCIASEGIKAREECVVDERGCLKWVQIDSCDKHQFCNDGDCECEYSPCLGGVWDSQDTVPGCVGGGSTILRFCNKDFLGCYYVDEMDCASLGKRCVSHDFSLNGFDSCECYRGQIVDLCAEEGQIISNCEGNLGPSRFQYICYNYGECFNVKKYKSCSTFWSKLFRK